MRKRKDKEKEKESVSTRGFGELHLGIDQARVRAKMILIMMLWFRQPRLNHLVNLTALFFKSYFSSERGKQKKCTCNGCKKSPISLQKSPISLQKSPVALQKSPISPQKSPISGKRSARTIVNSSSWTRSRVPNYHPK